MINNLFNELAELEQVEAIALGGSRSGENYDEKSDYDVYVYITSPISEEIRKEILNKYCSYMEIGNHYWEYEDNCVLNEGIDIDIIYRNLDDFCTEISDVVEKYQAYNGYTTCMWHNLLNSKIIYDKNERLTQAQKRFSVSYPAQLKDNIIKRNYNLLCNAMPAYFNQIEKACKRNDRVSIIHRTTAFLESYFDIIFALNSLTHPGEKRLVELCKQQCTILPNNFEANLNKLFDDMLIQTEKLNEDLKVIITELNEVI
ncbi:MAG: DUF4037 domain-containing protein [Lachnospiraceae bacterium]|nr:DUF4037 domain-containing protein [Lachnospiraceae bacterium]